MSSTIFAMKTISKTLGEMQGSRLKRNYKDYRTLTDTLREANSILLNQKPDEGTCLFLKLLKEKLEIETLRLSNLAEDTIEKGQIRDHHDCVLAYAKIDNLLRNIILSISGEPQSVIRSIHKQLSINPVEYKGEHLVLSENKEKADQLVLSNFNLEDMHIKHSGLNRINYSHPTKIIHTSDYKSLKIADQKSKPIVLHLDKEISLYHFITFVYPSFNKDFISNII